MLSITSYTNLLSVNSPNRLQFIACAYLLMVMTVSLKFSISSFADSGLNLVSGRSVFSDTDLMDTNGNRKIPISNSPTDVVW